MGVHASQEKIKKGLSVLGGRFKLLVSEDALEATLRPHTEDHSLSPEDLEALKKTLAQCGIVYGLLDPPEFENGQWILAQGFPPQKGQNGSIEILKKPQALPDEESPRDYREVNKLVCVRKGEVIAKKKPPAPGQPGKDVFGKVIPPPPVKESPLKLGTGVFLEKETQLIKAACSGVLEISEKKLEIHPSYTLEGDVDWETGNIHFIGQKLTITGNVCRGFKVFVEGDLEVNGIVEDESQIEVHGNLIINGLAHGESLQIKVKGEARFNEVEYASLDVSGSVVIGEYCLLSKVYAGGDIVVTEGVGAIIGGECRARGNIIARIIGSRAFVPTLVHAGYNAQMFEELEKLNARLNLIEKEKLPLFKTLNKALILIRQKQLSPEKLKIIEKLKGALEKLKREEEYLFQKREKFIQQLAHYERRKVVAINHIFPKVTVAIGRFHHLVVENKEKVQFELSGQQVIPKPLSLSKSKGNPAQAA